MRFDGAIASTCKTGYYAVKDCVQFPSLFSPFHCHMLYYGLTYTD